jgi:hypothetical protein
MGHHGFLGCVLDHGFHRKWSWVIFGIIENGHGLPWVSGLCLGSWALMGYGSGIKDFLGSQGCL